MQLFASEQASMDLWVVASWWSGKMAKNIFNLSPQACLAYAVAWEIIENSNLGTALWSTVGAETYTGESLINSFSDIAFVLCGYFSIVF